MAHKIIEDIEKLSTNGEKVKAWFDLGLSVKYGLSAELTKYMYDLYLWSSGDTSYNGRYNCFSCQQQIESRLKDFLNYGDNLGKPLLNWTKKEKKKINDDENKETDA